MLHTMLRRMNGDEKGFTLIELLVVILIIGILAAIALPTFLGQQKKGQDASAKSNARNLVTHLESCFAASLDYTQCAGANIANLGTTGLDIGVGPGQVTATASNANSYVVTATSKSGNVFTLTKVNQIGPSRACTGSGGGCNNGVW